MDCHSWAGTVLGNQNGRERNIKEKGVEGGGGVRLFTCRVLSLYLLSITMASRKRENTIKSDNK